MSKAPSINPFQRATIDYPREATITVESINSAALNAIEKHFAAVEALEKPRKGKGPLAVMLLSVEPGCGKSHLLGRLWKRLDDRATLIYLRANPDRHNLWTRMLERTVQELEYPDRAGSLVCTPEEPSQLDNVARHIIAGLLERAIEAGTVPTLDNDYVVPLLKSDPVRTLGDPAVSQWLVAQAAPLQHLLQKELRNAGLRLEAGARAWLQVLIRFTASRDADIAQLALQWIKGMPLNPEDGERLGLKPADMVISDEAEVSRNGRAFHRLADLCALASFYRPFLFAFDQTELYRSSPDLAHDFGAMIARLQAECINQLTVVTGNMQVWNDVILPCFEEADRDRFEKPSIEIVGVTAEEGRTLVETYLTEKGGIKPAKAAAFAQRPWFASLYSGVTRVPARRVLEAASKEMMERGPVTLSELYEEGRLRLLSTPRATDYDGSVLSWVLKDGMSRLPEVQIDKNHTSARYLTARWQVGPIAVFFVINESSQWRRWEAILREYEEMREEEAKAGRKCIGIALWHFKFARLGPHVSSKLKANKSFKLDVLAEKDMAELLAGQTLHAEIAQGDLPYFSGGELLEFLAGRWAGWKERFLADNEHITHKHGSDVLTKLIEAQLSRQLSLTWPMLRSRLTENVATPFTVEDVLIACQPLANNVKVFSTPSNHLFVWNGSRSSTT